MTAGKRYMVEVTNPDGEPLAVVDLAYGLAVAVDSRSADGVYVYPDPDGARIVVDDTMRGSAVAYLDAAECVRLVHYLLACAKAAES